MKEDPKTSSNTVFEDPTPSQGIDLEELTARLLELSDAAEEHDQGNATETRAAESHEGEENPSQEFYKVDEDIDKDVEKDQEAVNFEVPEKKNEEKENIYIDTIEIPDDEEGDDDSIEYRTKGSSFIVYGNVKIFLSGSPMLEDPVKGKTDVQRTGIPSSNSLMLNVKSVWWKADIGCGQCPSKFNCTCDLSIVDVVKNLTEFFDVVVIPDNNCTTCLQILDVIRKRNVTFCQFNLEDIDYEKQEDLILFLTTWKDCGPGLLHHWSHQQDNGPKVLETLGQELPSSTYFDIIVIGTGSASIGITEEAEKHGMSVCLVDSQTGHKSSLWGFDPGYSTIMDSLKMIFQETVEVMKALKHARFAGIANTDAAFFSWDAFRTNAQKIMQTLAWKHRISIQKKGTFIISGSPTIVDRNTIMVKHHLGDFTTLRGKNIVMAHHRRTYYQHFKGLHRFCLPLERLLCSGRLDVSKTLVYGPATVALEYGEIFNSLGLNVTVMMSSDFPPKFDNDMIEILISYMNDSGIEFIRKTQICHVGLIPRGANGRPAIPNALERFIVIGRNLETWDYSLYFFDNVIVLPSEEPWVPVSGLAEVGVKFSKYNPQEILVDENFRTAVKNIYVVSGRVDRLRSSMMFYEVTGRYFVQYLRGLRDQVLRPDLKFGLVSTRPEYGFYGLSEREARRVYGGDARVYHAVYNPWNVFSLVSHKPPSYIKLICRERITENGGRKVEDIVGLHVLGRRSAGNVVRGISFALSEGLTKEELDRMVSVRYSSAEAIIDMNILKKEEDPPLADTTCYSRYSK